MKKRISWWNKSASWQW